MGDDIARRTLGDMVFGIPVDARPCDVAMKDFHHFFMARVTRKYAAMGIAQHQGYKLGWDNGLEDESVGWPMKGFAEEDVSLYHQFAEVLFVEVNGIIPWWSFAVADEFLHLRDGVIFVLRLCKFLAFVIFADELNR